MAKDLNEQVVAFRTRLDTGPTHSSLPTLNYLSMGLSMNCCRRVA
jgi:hypothetical protein